jgi:hypothetical protein
MSRSLLGFQPSSYFQHRDLIMGLSTLVVQSLRCAILMLALRLCLIAEALDNFCGSRIVATAGDLGNQNVLALYQAQQESVLKSPRQENDDPGSPEILESEPDSLESDSSITSTTASGGYAEVDPIHDPLSSEMQPLDLSKSRQQSPDIPGSSPGCTVSPDSSPGSSDVDGKSGGEDQVDYSEEPDPAKHQEDPEETGSDVKETTEVTKDPKLEELGDHSSPVSTSTNEVNNDELAGEESLDTALVSSCKRTAITSFAPTIEEDNPTSSRRNAYQSITFMSAYRKYSFEELRLLDHSTCQDSDDITPNANKGSQPVGDDTWKATTNPFQQGKECPISHVYTNKLRSEMHDIELKMSMWRSERWTVLPCPDSGVSPHSLVTDTTHKYQSMHRISVLDRATDTYVNISEALAWCNIGDRTGLAVTIGHWQSPKVVCCPEEIMPSIYQQKTRVRVFVWDAIAKPFADVEDMLTTKTLRSRASLRIECHSKRDGKPSPYRADHSYSWREFVGEADFDGMCLRSLRAKGIKIQDHVDWHYLGQMVPKCDPARFAYKVSTIR